MTTITERTADVAIYARISEDREETQAGVTRQVEDCEEIAKRRNWATAHYVDNDISAYKGKRRPNFERMLADIEAGQLKAVIVWHQDRLIRQPRDLERFFDVCDKAGLTELASVSGDIDLSTHDGRMKARIIGAVSANQSDAASRRIRRKMEELAKAGRITGGGTRPFGFEEDRITIRESEAVVIRELAERALAGDTLRSICVDLRSRGILTSGNRAAWKPTPLRRMLRSARISGQREHRGKIVTTAVWPAIISPEQTTALRALFDHPSRQATRPARAYLLKGLVRCSHCDALLVGRPRDDGARRYVCATGPGFVGCGKTYVLSQPLEEFVAELVFARLDSPELERVLKEGHSAAEPYWHDEMKRLSAKLNELADAYARDVITMREWIAARVPVQDRLDEVRRSIAADRHTARLAQHIGQGVVLRDRWPGLSLDERHAIIGCVLAYVIAGPGRRGYNRFDPGRFEPIWNPHSE